MCQTFLCKNVFRSHYLLCNNNVVLYYLIGVYGIIIIVLIIILLYIIIQTVKNKFQEAGHVHVCHSGTCTWHSLYQHTQLMMDPLQMYNYVFVYYTMKL